MKIYSQNLRALSKFTSYLKNHLTNTRLVCTYLNPFFKLNPNVAKNLNVENFREKNGNLWLVDCS